MMSGSCQWICRSCGRNITLSDVPSLQPGQCDACSSPLGLVVDAHSGHATRCCTSCPRAAVPCAEQPVEDVPSWFSLGALSGFGAFFGWGSGPLTVLGSGTQSWMFCPLISLGLERAEVLRGVVPFSVGGRAQISPDQAQFWHRSVPHVIEALAAHFMGFSSSDPRAVALSSRESWGVGGDHLSPQLQESVVPDEVPSMMTVWLTAQVSQFQRDSEILQCSRTAPSTNLAFLWFHLHRDEVHSTVFSPHLVLSAKALWCLTRLSTSSVRRIHQDQHSPQASQSQHHQKWCLVLDQGG